MHSGSESDRYGMDRPGQVSSSPTTRHDRPPTIEITGNIVTTSAPARMSVVPGKPSRVILGAAEDANSSASSVVVSAMSIELRSAAKKPVWKTSSSCSACSGRCSQGTP